MSAPEHVGVLIVGGGPTGLAIANALGVAGISTLLVEQDPGVATHPRAVSIDDEAMRFTQRVGLENATRAIAVAGTGTKYFGARGQLLAYACGPARLPYGHPVKNPIDHQEFQQVLLDGLARFACVTVQHRTRLTTFTETDDVIIADIDGPCGHRQLTCDYLVGADGGRSRVRAVLGQDAMDGSAFEQRWLVLDTIDDDHDERFAMHYGDPSRPRVVVVGRDGRCRYEFLLDDDEQPTAGEVATLAIELSRPYRVLREAEIVRAAVYKFYALVARDFQCGRAFLAGDAAHMMPPFAGQGLNSGLRDAANLSWKLAAVVSGRAGPRLLESYAVERRPHVSATVRLSVRMGAVMMTRSRVCAHVRDVMFALARRVPAIDRFFAEMRFKPPARYAAGFLIEEASNGVAGSMLVQPSVIGINGDRCQLDDVLGPGFALLGLACSSADLERLEAATWDRLGATRVHVALDDRLPVRTASCGAVADADGLLGDQVGHLRGHIALVRPDRFIAGVFSPDHETEFARAVERGLDAAGPTRTSSGVLR